MISRRQLVTPVYTLRGVLLVKLEENCMICTLGITQLTWMKLTSQEMC